VPVQETSTVSDTGIVTQPDINADFPAGSQPIAIGLYLVSRLDKFIFVIIQLTVGACPELDQSLL
jgi:hypothetical protein